MQDERLRRCLREVILAEVTAGWTDQMRKKLHTGEGNERIYPMWYKALMTGEFDHLPQFVPLGKASIDVGALLGCYSLTLCSLATKCLCIEPLTNYAFLADVLPGNCVVRTVAAGDRPGEGVLCTPNYQYGLSSLLPNPWLTGAGQITQQKTRIAPLDDIAAEAMPDDPIGFIKIDAEGYELRVLTGAMQLLRVHRPNLQVEIGQENMKAVRELLGGLGYVGLFFYEDRLLDISQFDPGLHQHPDNQWSPEHPDAFDANLWVANFFFVPQNRL